MSVPRQFDLAESLEAGQRHRIRNQPHEGYVWAWALAEKDLKTAIAEIRRLREWHRMRCQERTGIEHEIAPSCFTPEARNVY